MFAIDNTTSVTSEPARPAAGTPGFFSEGSPGSGQPATVVPDWFLNMLQNELGHVVTQSGLALDKLDDTQLWQAIQRLTPPSSVFGCGLSRASATTLTVAAGRASNAAGNPLRLSSAMTKNLAAVWAAGSGNGALDSGSLAASTGYTVFLIAQATGDADVLISTSRTAPSLPAGYIHSWPVGTIVSNAAMQIEPFAQAGAQFILLEHPLMLQRSTEGAATVALPLPTGVNYPVTLNYWMDSIEDSLDIRLTHPGASMSGNNTRFGFTRNGTHANTSRGDQISTITDTLSQVHVTNPQNSTQFLYLSHVIDPALF